MSKKHLDGIDAFDMNQPPEISLQDIDANLFGQIQAVDESKKIARPIDIFEIYPDASQPRRSVPSLVRGKWSGDPYQNEELLKLWHTMVEEERGIPFHIDAYINADDVIRSESMGPLESSFLSLIELASSIKIDGLTNPITIAPSDNKYTLETGERRWLAYHLLFWRFGDKWRNIPARTVDRINIWRQAAENNSRANLNAISRARQLALLLIDLIADKREIAFANYIELISPGECDKRYYAQVADGSNPDFRIPSGYTERICSIMGLKNARQIRDYRGLLRLPDIVWQLADDLSWTEYFIRDLRKQAGSDDDQLIALAVDAAIESGYSVPVGTLSSGKLGRSNTKAKRKKPAATAPPGTKSHFTDLMRLLKQTGAGKANKNQTALEQLEELKRWVDAEAQRLMSYLDQ